MKMKSKIERFGAGILAGLVLVLGSLAATQAAAVTVDASNPYQDVGLVSGLDGASNPFDIGLAGTYRVKLTDFAFPADPFDTLRLIITSATEEYGRIDSPGSFLFTAAPGQYFASLVWDTSGDFDMGLYGIEVAYAGVSTAAVVPIPSSVLMLMSALGVLVFFRFYRRKENLEAACHAVPICAG